jgi:hypothetical protein
LDVSEEDLANQSTDNQQQKDNNEANTSGNNPNNPSRLLSRSLSSMGDRTSLAENDQRERALLVRGKIRTTIGGPGPGMGMMTMGEGEGEGKNDSGDAQSLLLLSDWDQFAQTKLREVLDHQTMGSYEIPTIDLMAVSTDDPLKLGVDLDVFGDDDPLGDDNNNGHDNFARFNNNMTKHHELHEVSYCCYY